ncbi:hypothetical protein SASPL_127152 [Salvia splendens]|uniref:diacylglycerol kinase (ATP) n=1 Tax=Salvia splendens TaxID=180675 RepID=A0A8X8XIG3_SALSN|nr:hypothetical protein SASPL_127152 [Salvia splendens]
MAPPRTPRRLSTSGRSSLIDSLRGFTLSGVRVNKEDLQNKITFPEYLRRAMTEAIRAKDADAASAVQLFDQGQGQQPSEWPLVVFINSKSGGRHGPKLKARLQELMGEEQVFDLSEVKPHEFVQYGLSCLENFANLGDNCAKATREKLKIVVAGGDGTVGWVLGCLGELNRQGRLPIPPTGVIPLGTGNDLSRSFGWGGSFPFNWKSSVKRTLEKVAHGPIARLDSWQVLISMPAGEKLELPYSLKEAEETPLDQELEVEGELPEKMIYSGYSCQQGWFCTPCSSYPGLRSLKNILRIHIKKVNHLKWEQIPVPSSVRSIVVLNLPSYGSGRNPWGKLKPDYLEKASDIRFELRGGEWKKSYLQMDGEPWKQPMDKDFSTFVEIKRVSNQSLMPHPSRPSLPIQSASAAVSHFVNHCDSLVEGGWPSDGVPSLDCSLSLQLCLSPSMCAVVCARLESVASSGSGGVSQRQLL